MAAQKKKFHPFVVGANIFVFAILLILGLNVGFVAETMTAPIFPGSLEPIRYLCAVLFGFAFALGAYGLYIHSELAYRAISHYDGAEYWLRLTALILLNASVIGIDIAGMSFRAQYLNDRGVGWLVLVGVICAFIPVLVGLVLTPIHHKPVEMLTEDMADDFARTTIEETYDHLLAAPTHEKRRALGGEMDDVIEGVIEEGKADAERERAAVQGRKIDAMSRRQAFTYAINPLSRRQPDFQEALPANQTNE